jgi:hypothetical protein
MKVGYRIGSREDKEYAPSKVVCLVSEEAYGDIKWMLRNKNSKYEVKPHLMYDDNGDWMIVVTSKRKK